MDFEITQAKAADRTGMRALISASVLMLQPEYTQAQRQAALQTVFTVDSRLIEDGTYLVARMEGVLAGCGGWSFRKTLYGGDHQVEPAETVLLDPARDAARIRAIFVHPAYARHGLGSLLLKAAENAAWAAGFRRFEMGSTLAGCGLYVRKGYMETGRVTVPVGEGENIEIVRMTKHGKIYQK